MHVGIILDGNRRYAKEKGLLSLQGHLTGVETVKKLLFEWAPSLVDELTLYTFSAQNFNRSEKEVSYLMKLFRDYFNKFMSSDDVMDAGIQVKFIGRLELLPTDIQDIIKQVQEKTKDNTKLIVNFAIAYGGREEIIDAIKKVDDIQGLTVENFGKYMYLDAEPELIIRTGGARRTSNFLMWQSWYSEWFFLEKFWPAFEKEDLVAVLDEFKERERRFGK